MNDLYLKGLFQKYHASKIEYNPVIKRLSEHKRNLVSDGLPVNFANTDNTTSGYIKLTDLGDVVVYYYSINGKSFNIPPSAQLIDASDEVLKTCEAIKDNSVYSRMEETEKEFEKLLVQTENVELIEAYTKLKIKLTEILEKSLKCQT